MVGAYLNVIASLSMKGGPRLAEAIATAQTVVAGNCDMRKREAALEACWDWLRVGARIGDMQSREALQTRLAIMLLDSSPTSTEERLECLSWFIDIIRSLHEDVNVAHLSLEASFSAYEKKRT